MTLRDAGAMLVAALAATLGAGWWLAAPFHHPVPRPAGLPVEDVAIVSASGARLAGWFARGSRLALARRPPEGAAHEDLLDHSPGEYRRRVPGFLEAHGRAMPVP